MGCAPDFPKGTNLRVHSPDQVAAEAAELNDRPRKTLGWDTPTVRLGAALSTPGCHQENTGRWVLPASGCGAARMAPMADLGMAMMCRQQLSWRSPAHSGA
jgi:hypothetical protein